MRPSEDQTNRSVDVAGEEAQESPRGWYCGHFFYRWNREHIAKLDSNNRASLGSDFKAIVEGTGSLPSRMQTISILGHKADFGIVMMDPDPRAVQRIHHRLMGLLPGGVLDPTYSFVSLSEVSEYLPTIETYKEKLMRSGEDPLSPGFLAKVSAYERRLPSMIQHRIAPEFPDWQALCFYPMSKSRLPGANWYELPFSERADLMSEHAQSGIRFSGRVTQLVTSSFGLDDWEWGVTLWGTELEYLKQIVYRMRFDRASAKYGQFGPFYVGLRANADEILAQGGIRGLE